MLLWAFCYLGWPFRVCAAEEGSRSFSVSELFRRVPADGSIPVPREGEANKHTHTTSSLTRFASSSNHVLVRGREWDPYRDWRLRGPHLSYARTHARNITSQFVAILPKDLFRIITGINSGLLALTQYDPIASLNLSLTVRFFSFSFFFSTIYKNN